MSTVRDRLWLWCHPAGSHNGEYGLTGQSEITPAEAARYLGLSNAIMVRYHGKPVPPYHAEAASLSSLSRVVWSVVGAGGTTEGDEVDHVISLSRTFPNLRGAIMDDFFRIDVSGSAYAHQLAVFTPEEVASMRKRLNEKTLDLWAVIYTHQLDHPVSAHLDQFDVVTLWTWRAKDLPSLESNLERLENLTHAPRKVLGYYMWDYGDHRPMPVDLMRYQCEQGLKWLKAGRIDGLIFLASCICDLGLDAVEWTRRWIGEVGDRTLINGS